MYINTLFVGGNEQFRRNGKWNSEVFTKTSESKRGVKIKTNQWPQRNLGLFVAKRRLSPAYIYTNL